jgi:hypothetical protein
VPADGAEPTALTPLRRLSDSHGDYGDLDARQVTSGLYLQSCHRDDALMWYDPASGATALVLASEGQVLCRVAWTVSDP